LAFDLSIETFYLRVSLQEKQRSQWRLRQVGVEVLEW
jgi:hypothetical protein